MENIKQELKISGLMLMYVGNLESYQGIDLMLESFALTKKKAVQADLVIIGGEEADIAKYRQETQRLGIDSHVHFLGAKPVEDLAMYLSQADILLSPRTKGKNTPMKLYSYLDSGKALLVTNLPTHTQVLDNRSALLTSPEPEAFSQGMVKLLADEALRNKLGYAGKQLVQQRHTYQVFQSKLNDLYDWLQVQVQPA